MPPPSRVRALHISICPNFDSCGSVATLTLSMNLLQPGLSANESLCVLVNKMGNGTTQCYSSTEMHVSDDRGRLAVETRDESTVRHYLIGRATAGNVLLTFTAIPVEVGPKTPIGGRYELRKDQGGAQFMGMSVIPIPWDGTIDSPIKYNVKIDWNISKAPVGTRGVSSFGDGSVTRLSRTSDIWRMIFAVGPVRSYPPPVAGLRSGFGFYWFGDLPPCMAALPSLCSRLFEHMAGFFGDQLSEENPYRVFVRRVTPARGFGGTGGLRSFELDYDDYMSLVHQDEIVNLLAHEMVHNWPLMQSLPGTDMDLIAWYNEGAHLCFSEVVCFSGTLITRHAGVADYYATLLPYRLGLESQEDFLKRANAKLTEYYTNPLRLTSNRDVQDKAWTSPNLQTLSYTRGMVYLLKLDAEIRSTTHGRKSVDSIILSLLGKLRTEQRHGIPEWKDLVASNLGEQALHDFDAMNKGRLIRLPPNTFGPGHRLERTQQRELDFGFDASSFFEKVVVGLREQTEAARAGLKEGDEILWHTYVWQCQTDYTRNVMLVVKQGEEEKMIEYWPRSEQFVESWKLCVREQHQLDPEYALSGWEWIEPDSHAEESSED